ncbi:MAG TPA: SDR family NAD(P)-dependent oxidoreductase, partial [Streptosporangiaceae bacterium]
ALRHGLLPPTLHAAEPSPHVDWSPGTVRLLTEPVDWPPGEDPRRAGVSAFGLSGTNAHIILEEPPADDDAAAGGLVPGEDRVPVLAVDRAGWVPWVVSGRSAAGLAAQAGRLAADVTARPDLDPGDVGWSLATSRSVFEHRAVVTGAGREELLAGLGAVAAGEPAAGVVTGSVPAGGAGRVAFVFPGQGSQWAGMGAELLGCSPVFASRLAECGRALAPYVDWDLTDVISGAPGAPGLESADVVQPALWAVMVSLAAVWQAAGVTPDAVVGHSQGEIAAATVAGILSLEDAARVVTVRGRALSDLGGGGAMVSVVMPEAAVRELVARWGESLSVAAVNSPAQVVVSGERGALAEFEAELSARHVLRWPVPASDFVAHSAKVDELAGILAGELAPAAPGAGGVRLFSTVHARWMDGPELDAGYWFANVRQTVRFDAAVRALAGEGYRVFAEVSAHPVLTAAVTETVHDADPGLTVLVTGTLEREDAGARRLLSVLAGVHVHGVSVDWAAVTGSGQRVELPTYAFQRERYWPEAAQAPAGRGGAAGNGAVTSAEARFWAAVEGEDVTGLAGLLPAAGPELGSLVPALAAWRRREQDRSATQDWWYRVSWVPVPEPVPVMLPGTWLLVTPAGPASLARDCERALAARGARVVVTEITTGELDRDILAGRIGQALADDTGVRAVSGVLSLLALDEGPTAGFPTVAGGLAGTLALVQALGGAGIRAPLWVLTCGAVAARADEMLTSPVQGQVWGLGRVAALEHPDRWGGLIDLPPVLDERAGARLCAVLAGIGEDQVAIRGAGILGRRLVRAPQPRDQHAWRPGGTVLVTGGTGALGGHVARWLAGRGAPRVVLTSRGGPAAPGATTLAAALGTAVEVVACDIADRAQVAGLLTRIGADGPPLTAVVHTAGVGQATTLADTSVTELAAVARGKVAGATHLDELTRPLNLEQFVLFSSAAATWGSGGEPGYAAANAYLDGLAQVRRAKGLPAVAVGWGPWSGGGLIDEDSELKLQRRGLPLLNPGPAIRALGQLLDAGETMITVADVDWPRFTPPFTLLRPSPLIQSLPEVQQARADADAASEEPAAPGAGTALGQQLAGLSPGEQDRVLMALVRAEAAVVLGHPSAEAVEVSRAFSELGFDSLTAVELRNRLSAATGLRLPATLLFDYPRTAAVAAFLRSQLAGERAADPAARPDQAAPGTATAGEPIAIVAMSCRFPGGVRSPEDLWELVLSGTDAISGLPADRGWDLDQLYDPDPEQAGTSYVRSGGFVPEVADFDPGLFGISPREALGMDPQQRLVLETSWEALERAGIDPGSLRGSATGVFVGAAPSGYGAGLEGDLAGHLLTGTAGSVLSGRVSYVLGLEGPAVTIDTACSSALVALHLACAALRAGECELALAGGTWVTVTPDILIGFSRQRGLAADGRCKAFSADADGMAVGEGAGVVVVERLSDARRNGHPVLAVVAGSAINQDGASNGLTAPNGPSQQRVIRAALASAGLSADQVDAVEAHGTGTKLGDPIEAQALIATYGQDRDRPLWLGSVKSNIGHPQQAAGAAGVIKVVLALQHGMLPPTLHAAEPSPHVDWTAGQVRLLTEPVPWPANGRPRRAGVSAFGMSGTNVHAIIEEPPAADPAPATGDGPVPVLSGPLPWLVSARTAAGLRAQAARLTAHVAACPDLDPADVGWSLATGRSVLEHRAVVLGSGREELLAGLAAVAAGPAAAGVTTGMVRASDGIRVGFVFAGQGSQRAGMGAQLHACSPVFAAAFDQACALLEAELGVPVAEVVLGSEDDERADQTLYAQAGLFAVEAGLVALLAACGITPDAVAGHSVGEVTAAYAAGVLTLEDACALVGARARLMQALPGGGAMTAIAATEAEVTEALDGVAGVSVAAVNGPSAVVISGDAEAVEQVAGVFADRGVRTRRLRVSHAFHSHRMDPVLGELADVAGGLAYAAPRIPWAGALTGELVTEPGAGYWARQAREPVRFADAVMALTASEISVFIEIGPDGTLSALGPDAVDDEGSAFIPVLRPGQPAAAAVLAALARAHVSGADVDWAAVLAGGQRIDLPTYAFQHQRFWPQPRAALMLTANGSRDGAGSVAEERFWAAVDGGDVAGLSAVLAVDGERPFGEVLPVLASWRR